MPDGSINEAFNLASYIKGKNAVVFFYPLDFTFVCPPRSGPRQARRRIRQAQQGGDRRVHRLPVHPPGLAQHAGGKRRPGPHRDSAGGGRGRRGDAAYGVEHPANVALRGSFLIDSKGIVRHAVINDLPLGRDADEMLRMVDALQFHEEHGEVCPAGCVPARPA